MEGHRYATDTYGGKQYGTDRSQRRSAMETTITLYQDDERPFPSAQKTPCPTAVIASHPSLAIAGVMRPAFWVRSGSP